MENNRSLFQLSADMVAIEDALWESGGELTPELEVALTETSQSLATKADGYNKLIRSFASKASAIDQEIKRLTALKKVAENAEKRLKERILYCMDTFGLDKLEGDFCKFSVSKSSRTDVDEDILLAGFTTTMDTFNKDLPPYITAELKVSKTALKKYCEETGIKPEGVEFIISHSLRMR